MYNKIIILSSVFRSWLKLMHVESIHTYHKLETVSIFSQTGTHSLMLQLLSAGPVPGLREHTRGESQ